MRTSTTRSLHGRPSLPAKGSIDNAALGAAIRDRRRQLGLRQEVVAARAGIDHRVLSRLERGERACRVPELVAIAEALRFGPAGLLRQAARQGSVTPPAGVAGGTETAA